MTRGDRRIHSVGVALSGGAARCIAHIGVLEVLEEEGIPLAGIAGTSGGSLIGALYASGEVSLDGLKKMAREITWKDVFMPTIPRQGLISSEKIYRYVRGVIGDRTFSDLKIPLAVVASDLQTGEKVVLTSGSVARAVQASCSLPVVFTPARMEGRLLMDGGMVSLLPVLAAKDVLRTPFVIAVDVNFNAAASAPVRNIVQIAIHFLCLVAHRTAVAEKKYADAVIEVDARGTSLYDLDKADLFLERGRTAAEKKIGEIRERLTYGGPW